MVALDVCTCKTLTLGPKPNFTDAVACDDVDEQVSCGEQENNPSASNPLTASHEPRGQVQGLNMCWKTLQHLALSASL